MVRNMNNGWAIRGNFARGIYRLQVKTERHCLSVKHVFNSLTICNCIWISGFGVEKPRRREEPRYKDSRKRKESFCFAIAL